MEKKSTTRQRVFRVPDTRIINSRGEDKGSFDATHIVGSEVIRGVPSDLAVDRALKIREMVGLASSERVTTDAIRFILDELRDIESGQALGMLQIEGIRRYLNPEYEETPESAETQSPTSGKEAIANEVPAKYSQKRIAVDPSGSYVAQSANPNIVNEPGNMYKEFRFNVYDISGDSVTYVGNKSHRSICVTTPNSTFYDMAFSPDGSALWAVTPVTSNSPFYDIIRFDTTTWIGTDFCHFGQLELSIENVQEQERSMITVVKTDSFEKALAIKQWSTNEATVFELDPQNPANPGQWRFDSYKPAGNSAFKMRTIVRLFVSGDLVYAVGWAKVNSSPTDVHARAAVIVARADDHSLVHGPYYVDDFKAYYSSHNYGPMVPHGKLHTQLSPDGNSIYLSTEEQIARINLTTGETTLGETIPMYGEGYYSLKIRGVNILDDELYAVIEQRLAQYTVESRSLVKMSTNLVRTSISHPLPISDIRDWREHPGNPSELIISKKSDDYGMLQLWNP